MNCKKCGAMIEIGKSFCSNCGTPVSGAYSAMSSQGGNAQSQKGAGSGMGPVICGILAIIFDCMACLFFPIGIISVILGIFGIIYGGKGYRENGTPAAHTGKILSIVALVLLGFCVIICIIFWIAVGGFAYYDSLPWYEKL